MKMVVEWAEKILANVFCFFFVVQILSPMVTGKTIYIDFLLAVFNPFFLLWISKYRISMDYIVIILLLGFIGVLGHPMTSMKIVFTLIEVMYLFYIYDRRLWYIHYYIQISILVAAIQIYGLLFDPNISLLLSPENLSHMVWGAYATPTNSNFYALVEDGIPHVSGLSREAGFMASLLLAGIYIEYLFSKEGYWSTSKLAKVFYIIGYVISFTKMSFLIAPVYIIHRLRGVINMMPLCFVFAFWIVGMMIYWSFNQNFLLDTGNITFLHRFGAYVSLWNLDTKELIFGVDNLTKIDSYVAHTIGGDYDFFAGFGGWLITNGLLSGMIYLLILYRLHITGCGLLLLFLLTVNVQPDTNQNFVVLAYFILLKFYRRDRLLL